MAEAIGIFLNVANVDPDEKQHMLDTLTNQIKRRETSFGKNAKEIGKTVITAGNPDLVFSVLSAFKIHPVNEKCNDLHFFQMGMIEKTTEMFESVVYEDHMLTLKTLVEAGEITQQFMAERVEMKSSWSNKNTTEITLDKNKKVLDILGGWAQELDAKEVVGEISDIGLSNFFRTLANQHIDNIDKSAQWVATLIEKLCNLYEDKAFGFENFPPPSLSLPPHEEGVLTALLCDDPSLVWKTITRQRFGEHTTSQTWDSENKAENLHRQMQNIKPDVKHRIITGIVHKTMARKALQIRVPKDTDVAALHKTLKTLNVTGLRFARKKH